MERLIDLLHSGEYSCVMMSRKTVYTFVQRGVADLCDLYQSDPGFMKGASVADKVVGKAAAALLVLGKAGEVYADVISTPALALLREARIDVAFRQEVPFIENREKSGWCPLESACYRLKSVAEMYPVIRDFIAGIRMKKTFAGVLLACVLGGTAVQAKAQSDTARIARNVVMDEVVVTGTRHETDIRHLPMTVSVVNRSQIEKRYEPSLLPVLTEQVPGFFTTSRGVMGYGVSTGAAGGDEPERCRRQSYNGFAGADRRASSVYGIDGASYCRRLSIDAGRTGGGVAGTGVCAVRLECDGRGGQYRYP